MKILHTADWHIGKLVHGLHMTHDQRELLEQFKTLVVEEKPDVIVIAGDIYDRAIPPTDAVELLDDILTQVVITLKTPVIIITGNHDSPDRLGFGSQLLKERGLHIVSSLKKEPVIITLEDSDGPVDFYPIPFTEPAFMRELYENEEIKSPDEVMKAITDQIKAIKEPNRRSVCIAHGFVMGSEGLETSDSERPLTIGGSEFVRVDYFDGFDYVALGHLHKPQKVKHETIRYSGSLMKYSFSEANQKKSITMVTLDEQGHTTIRQVFLKPIRDMRVIKGEFQKLITKEVYSLGNQEDYILAVLTDEGPLVEPMQVMRSVYPNILRIERENLMGEGTQADKLSTKDFEQKTTIELFEAFYAKVTEAELSEDQQEIISSYLSKENSERRYE